MDDTLIYTSYANFIAYKMALYENMGLSLEHTPHERFTKEHLQKKFQDTLLESDFTHIISSKNSLFEACISYTMLNYPLVTLLKKYAKSDKQVILLTNSNRTRAIQLLKHYKLYHLFDKVIVNPKSHPNKYETLKRHTPLLNQEILLFENEDKEIDNALCVGIDRDRIVKI
jgi:FMN phosphatase YigB (HAD superfamily)